MSKPNRQFNMYVGARTTAVVRRTPRGLRGNKFGGVKSWTKVYLRRTESGGGAEEVIPARSHSVRAWEPIFHRIRENLGKIFG